MFYFLNPQLKGTKRVKKSAKTTLYLEDFAKKKEQICLNFASKCKKFLLHLENLSQCVSSFLRGVSNPSTK